MGFTRYFVGFGLLSFDNFDFRLGLLVLKAVKFLYFNFKAFELNKDVSNFV